MTARLACSAADPTHHLAPGSPSSKNNRIFSSASQGSGLCIGSCPENVSLIKYLHVGELVCLARIKTLSATFSIIKGFETFTIVRAFYWCVGVHRTGIITVIPTLLSIFHRDYTILQFLNTFIFRSSKKNSDSFYLIFGSN